MEEIYRKLVAMALQARERAYAPYSNFRVGAALLTESGEIFTGCNVENASYGLTNCAERTAIFKAVSEGHTSFQALAVVTDLEEQATPCGACRQVLTEFGSQIQVLLAGVKGDYRVTTSGQLLPASFTACQLEQAGEGWRKGEPAGGNN